MKNIEVKVLNPNAIGDAEVMMVAMARMTQRGHAIHNMSDFEELLRLPYSENTLHSMSDLPHPTLQKFAAVNIAVVGASRRFLAQITRHQNEVKFMSGSLQYSDYSGSAQFVVPYEITEFDATHDTDLTGTYLKQCSADLTEYEALSTLVGRDAAGYKMPQGMRNVLMISALPFEWKHMISQRICNRNSLETQYVLLKCWEALVELSPMFDGCGPSCVKHNQCAEGKMSCGHFLYDLKVSHYMLHHDVSMPTAILNTKFKHIMEVAHD